MRTYKFEASSGTYKLQLKRRNHYDKDFSHEYVEYTLTHPDKTIIFLGNDFGCPLHMKPESKRAARELLGFLTLKPGDTDQEWFDVYNPSQLAWCNSFDCEELSLYAMEK